MMCFIRKLNLALLLGHPLHVAPYILISYRTHTTSHQEFFLFSQSGANLQRDQSTHHPCSRHPGIEQNKNSYPMTKGTEYKKKTKQDTTLSIAATPHPSPEPIHIELPIHPP